MSKTLGQVAYEAWRRDKRDLPYGKEIAAWEIRPYTDHRSWQAAAQAVELAVGPQPVIDDLDARMSLAVAERAVIEAAEAAQPELEDVIAEDIKAGRLHTKIDGLLCAVLALQEAWDE